MLKPKPHSSINRSASLRNLLPRDIPTLKPSPVTWKGLASTFEWSSPRLSKRRPRDPNLSLGFRQLLWSSGHQRNLARHCRNRSMKPARVLSSFELTSKILLSKCLLCGLLSPPLPKDCTQPERR